MSKPKPLKYTDEVDPTWSTAAVQIFEVTPLPDAADPVALEIKGTCPRCKDHMHHTEFLVAFKGVTQTSPDALQATVKTLRDSGVLNDPLLPAEFSIRCGCKVKHPDRLGRTGLKGCGAIWKMRIESTDGAAK